MRDGADHNRPDDSEASAGVALPWPSTTVATRHVTVGILMAVRMAVRMAVFAFMHMRVIVAVSAAMILFAQTAMMLGGLPALGHLVYHVGLHAVATHREHRATQERAHVGVFRASAPGWRGRQARP